MADDALTDQDLADLEKPADIAPAEPAMEGPAAPGSADALIDSVNAQPLAAPVSGAAPDEAAWPPPVPAEAPGAVPASGEAAAASEAPATSEDVIKREGELKKEDAGTLAKQATDAAEEQRQHEINRQADALEAEQHSQAARDNLASKIAAYDKQKELRDPRSSWSTVDVVRNKVAILFGGLGAAFTSAGGGSSENQVLTNINKRLDQETERQKFNIARASDDVVMARAGVKDAEQARAQLDQDEDARHVSRLNTIIAQGTATLKAKGATAEDIATDKRLVQLRAEQAKVKQKADDDATKRGLVVAQTRAANAHAGLEEKKAKGGGAGAGGGAGLDELLKMKEGGAKTSEIATRARQLGLKAAGPNGWLAAVEHVGADMARDAKNATGEDNPLAVRLADGTVGGLAPSSRVVKQMQDRDVQYDQAIRSLEQLKASGDHIPVGSPLYDKAVLAVAATTQANASDKTTAHEAGTLKKYGLINGAAIDNVMEDLKQRQAQFRSQLRPLPAPKAPSVDRPAATQPPAFHPAKAEKGEKKQLPDGTWMEKMGPNDWQPVKQ